MRMKTENNMSWTRITTFPHTTGAVTISRPTSGQAIEVTLTPTPRHNGSTVTCVGESKSKRGEQRTTIYVRWPPSVRNLTVHGSASSRSPVAAHKPAAIRCQLQKGNPIREATATVETPQSTDADKEISRKTARSGGDIRGIQELEAATLEKRSRNLDLEFQNLQLINKLLKRKLNASEALSSALNDGNNFDIN